MTAMLLVLASSGMWSLSSGSWTMALSAEFLLDWKAAAAVLRTSAAMGVRSAGMGGLLVAHVAS